MYKATFHFISPPYDILPEMVLMVSIAHNYSFREINAYSYPATSHKFIHLLGTVFRLFKAVPSNHLYNIIHWWQILCHITRCIFWPFLLLAGYGDQSRASVQQSTVPTIRHLKCIGQSSSTCNPSSLWKDSTHQKTKCQTWYWAGPL